MPAYAVTSLPPAAERAINAFGGNAARMAILGYVMEHEGSGVSEIAEGTQLAVGTVKTHLSALVALKVLTPDPAASVPYADRRGRRTRYSVNTEQLLKQYRQLGKLLGIAGNARSKKPSTSD